ncbi:MAG: aminotransferase class I/II-fold pyridoxal phosphate-dependent enzyme [Burkholderiales bacterium]|nr:aminotransferase class I/II-fold pyridoxal phosphate-dependent enzyme [Burkholderiales bacterium]
MPHHPSPHGPHTLLVHADADIDADSSIAPPIYPSVTYRANTAEDFRAMATEARHPRFYARYGSPTHARVETLVAELEGAEAALAFASGMAAISSAVLSQLRAGDHVVAQRSHYMGTTQLLGSVLERFGVASTIVDQTDVAAFESALRPETRLVLVESPSNPLLQLTDLAAVAACARRRGITTIADNTFATPINQKPIELGVDMVVHSATKFLGGHHDLLAGVIAGRREAVERAWDMSIVLGASLGAFEAWLLLRGLRTLGIRVERQNATALAVAEFLERHPAVAAVHYPGLASHPQHALARRQMRAFGGVVSVVLRAGATAAQRFMQNTKLFAQAVSLGGIESLAMHAATTWSGTLTEEQTRAAGVDPGLVRLSVGLEDASDLIADLDQALPR